MKTKHILSWLTIALLTSTASAQVPQLISYQGRVSVGAADFHGTGRFKFALVGTNALGAAVSLWSNDGTSTDGKEPTAAVSLAVDKGLYSVLLGDATLPNMRIVPATVFTNSDVRLRVWFSDATGGFEQLVPDQRFAAVGYALMTATVADGAITSAKLAPGAVTADKLAAGAVGAGNIASGQVVKSFNSLKDDVALAAGPNVTLSTNGNTLQISAAGGSTGGSGWGLAGTPARRGLSWGRWTMNPSSCA
jgi:hypothetical protein